jgi:hypothetical protein
MQRHLWSLLHIGAEYCDMLRWLAYMQLPAGTTLESIVGVFRTTTMAKYHG